MRTTSRIAITGAMLTSTVVAATTAFAAPVESYIGFGFLDDGTRLADQFPITDEYEAGDGIVFVPSVSNLFCDPTNAICNSALTGDAVATAPLSAEFEYTTFGIQFTDVVRDTVSFGMRAMDTASAPVPYTINAYTPSGGLVGTTSGSADTTWRTISFTAPAPEQRIAYVGVAGGGAQGLQLLIDDVRSTGDDTYPSPDVFTRPDVDIILPVSDTYRPGELPFTLPFETYVTSIQPLSRVSLTIRRSFGGGTVFDDVVLCGPPPARGCPQFEFRHVSDLLLERRGVYELRVTASTIFLATDTASMGFTVADPIPEQLMIGVELNQGVQGQVNIVDDVGSPAQEYVSPARLIPGKDMLIRRYHVSSYLSLSWTPPALPVYIRRPDGSETLRTLTPILVDGATAPDPTAIVHPTDQSEWPYVISQLRRTTNATANYVLPGSETSDATAVTVGAVGDPHRFRAEFDESSRLGVNVVGLFDDANSIPRTTLEEFTSMGLPWMNDMLPYTTVEALSYHAAHWSELPHSSNDHLNDEDDPDDDTPHQPGCAIASSMRLWGFGSEAERGYSDWNNSWVVDAGVMMNGKSDRNLRGCAFTFLAPLRAGGTFTSDLDETLVHEAGHIHGFPHATELHGEARGELWPYRHGWMSPVELVAGGWMFPHMGVRIVSDEAGRWQPRVVDPCTMEFVVDCASVFNEGRVRHDVMSYGGDDGVVRWVSLPTWNRFYDIAVNDISRRPTDPDLIGPFSLAAGAPADEVEAVIVSGRLTNDGTWVLDHAIAKPVPPEALDYADPPDPDFVVRAVGADGAVLDERGGKIGSTEDNPDGLWFGAPLLSLPDTVAYEVLVDGLVVATLGERGAAPVITDLTVTEPDGDFVRASWNIVDPGDAGHTTVIWVSYDGGDSWLPGAYVQPGQDTSVRLWVADRPAGSDITVRMVVSDGFSSTRTDITGSRCFGFEPTIVGDGGTIVGTDGDDVILGTAAGETIHALQGNDIVCGAGGDDTIDGGTGDDTIDGGTGNDTIHGFHGPDRLLGGDGNDALDGGRGNDDIAGGNGDDQLLGQAGNDVLIGGDGDDELFGHAGNDVLVGGNGDDVTDGGSGRNDVTP